MPRTRRRVAQEVDALLKSRSKRVRPSEQPPRVAYRLQLTPAELQAVAFARGRYAWADLLAAHVSEDGLVGFSEPEMWQWTDDVDSDAEGGHAPFPLASATLQDKLQRFYDERI